MSDFIEVLSPKALSDLAKLNTELTNIVKNVATINSSMASISLPSQADTASKKLTDEYKKQELTIQQLQQKLQKAHDQQQKNLEKTRLAEIRLQQAREKAFDKYEKQYQREQAKLNASQNLYNKVQAKLTALQNEYKGLATKKELGITLTDKEEKTYQRLRASIDKYDKVLKGVDATMGKHQRKVGDYASGFSPISNSINQLTREMPAFANSMQTGFMAISNNLPIFFDAISQAVKQNKELQAQGQPTESVFKSVAGAIFSVGTALSIGVTLLTVYGKDIVEFFTGATDVVDEFNNSVNEIESTFTERAVKLKVVSDVLNDTSSSQQQLNDALKVAKDEGVSLNAIEQARSGNLALINKEMTQLIDLSIKRAKADKIVSLLVENEIAQDKLKLESRENYNKGYRKLLRSMGQFGMSVDAQINKNSVETLKELEKQNVEYYKMLRELGLSNLVDDEKVGKEKKEAQRDFLKDKYEAEKSSKELELKTINEFLVDESKQWFNRLEALELYRKKKNEIIALTYNEEMRLAKDNQYLQKIALNKFLSESLDVINDYAKQRNEILNNVDDYINSIGEGAKIISDQTKAEALKFVDGLLELVDEIGETAEKVQKQIDDLLNGFLNDFAKDSGFPTLFKVLNGEIIGFGDNWKTTFVAMAEIAQEAFAFISEASNQRFQNEYDNLARQKEIALLFAGESASGREAIEKQYDDRVRQIRRREARAKKAQAIFDIGINTAQAIMATLGKTGFAGLPTALIVGSIGAIQAGIVASQKIPEFWTGVENSNYEGWATKDERGAELHFDKKGNIKDFGQNKGAKYTYVEKGDTILDAKKTIQTKKIMDSLMFNQSLNSLLTDNAILPPKMEFNNNNKDVEREIRNLNNTVANKEGVVIQFNETGFKKYLKNGNSLKEIENKRFTGVGSSV